MIKYIGQHIFDFIARFRSDVYVESIAQKSLVSPTEDFTDLSLDNNTEATTGAFVFVDGNGKLFKHSESACFADAGMQLKPSKSNSDLILAANGTGSLVLKAGGGIVTEGMGLYDVAELRLKEAFGGSEYVGFKPPTTLAANCVWTLPSADGTSGQAMVTNGSKVLTFASVVSESQFNNLASKREYAIPSAGVGNANGDVLYAGVNSTLLGNAVATGKIYVYGPPSFGASNGTWVETDASAASTSTGLLAIALGTSTTVDGMLLRGMVDLNNTVLGTETAGMPLYLSETTGFVDTVAPSTSGAIVRIIGYAMEDGNDNRIWFNPDNSYTVVP